MNNYFVILAAGKSKRFHKNIPKQFYNFKNKEVIEHSIEKSLNSKLFKKILVVSNNLGYFKKKKYSKSIIVIKGGKDRSDSSLNALKYLRRFNPHNVCVHDAARPNFSIKLLKDIQKNLKKNKAVVPIINSRDSIKYKFKNQIFNLDKDKSFFTQTPQGFRFKELYNLSNKLKRKLYWNQ